MCAQCALYAVAGVGIVQSYYRILHPHILSYLGREDETDERANAVELSSVPCEGSAEMPLRSQLHDEEPLQSSPGSI